MAILQQQLTQDSTASPNGRYVMQPTQRVRIGPSLGMAELLMNSANSRSIRNGVVLKAAAPTSIGLGTRSVLVRWMVEVSGARLVK